MIDIVERLRQVTEDDAYALPWTFGETCKEAADEIVRLRSLATQHHQGGAVMEEAVCLIKDALEDAGHEVGGTFCRNIATSIFALAQQPLSVQEPVAWLRPVTITGMDGTSKTLWLANETDHDAFPVYAAPTVGGTGE